MSVTSELQRINNAKDSLVNQGLALGLSRSDGETLEELAGYGEHLENIKIEDVADAFGTIELRGENDLSIADDDGAKVEVEGGYYPEKVQKSVTVRELNELSVSVDEDGLVSAVLTQPAGYVRNSERWGEYQLPTEEGSIFTPIKSKFPSVLVEGGTYVKGNIAVASIPDKYQDVSSVTATAADVLTSKKIVLPDGTAVDGQIPIIGEQDIYLGYEGDGEWIEFHQIEKGYHDGESTIFIVKEAKEATPDKTLQVIMPSLTRVLEKVTVNPIPDTFLDTTDTANRKDEDNITASGATVTVEAGYYPNGASKSVKNVGKVEVVADPLVADDQSGVMRNLQINAFVTEIDVLLDPSLEEALAAI